MTVRDTDVVDWLIQEMGIDFCKLILRRTIDPGHMARLSARGKWNLLYADV